MTLVRLCSPWSPLGDPPCHRGLDFTNGPVPEGEEDVGYVLLPTVAMCPDSLWVSVMSKEVTGRIDARLWLI